MLDPVPPISHASRESAKQNNFVTKENEKNTSSKGMEVSSNVGIHVQENIIYLKASELLKETSDDPSCGEKPLASSDNFDKSNEEELLSNKIIFPNETPPAAENGSPVQNLRFRYTYHWTDKPDWFNMEKIKKGQAVAMKYISCISIAEMIALLMVFTFRDGLGVLISTAKSHTPYKAFKRYLSTALRVKSWYTDDIWEPGTEGYKNIKAVRDMHYLVYQRIGHMPQDEIANKYTVEKIQTSGEGKGIWSPQHDTLLQDFRESFPPSEKQCFTVMYRRDDVATVEIGQAVAQFGFIALFILFPEKFGAHDVSDEEMENFIHLWRYIGYALGVTEDFNLCRGSLENVRERCRDIINFWVKPNLREVSRDWEHMSRCMVEGISYFAHGITFEFALLMFCDVLDIPARRIRASLSLLQKAHYYLAKFVFKFLCRLPGVREFLNWSGYVMTMRAKNAGYKWHEQLKRKRYSFLDIANGN